MALVLGLHTFDPSGMRPLVPTPKPASVPVPVAIPKEAKKPEAEPKPTAEPEPEPVEEGSPPPSPCDDHWVAFKPKAAEAIHPKENCTVSDAFGRLC